MRGKALYCLKIDQQLEVEVKNLLGRKVQDELERVRYEAQSGLVVAPHLQMLKTMKRR